jgi:hypothetical protein
MKIEKEKRHVQIICDNDFLIKGYVHINPGERIIDFLNNERGSFIVVTEAEFYGISRMRSFRLFKKVGKNSKLVLLNKQSIKIMEELPSGESHV